jgi:hypothetical protein
MTFYQEFLVLTVEYRMCSRIRIFSRRGRNQLGGER